MAVIAGNLASVLSVLKQGLPNDRHRPFVAELGNDAESSGSGLVAGDQDFLRLLPVYLKPDGHRLASVLVVVLCFLLGVPPDL